VFQRLATTYTTYAHRNDVLAPVRSALPDSAQEIGFVAGSNDTDYSLWHPFGVRRVIWLRDRSRPGLQVPPGLKWMVIKRAVWPEVSEQPLEDWAAAHHATIVAEVPVTTLVTWGAENWCVLRLEEEAD
jgi:hypothetical protein